MKSKRNPQAALERRLRELRREIEHHNFLYHTRGEPEISDPEFDLLFRELIELESQHPALITPDSPTQRVGSARVGEFPSFSHVRPMRSLNNAFSSEDVEAFDRRTREALSVGVVTYSAEPKIDGFAITLIYDQGSLVHAATRGDGYTGDDLLENVRLVARIPKQLKDSAPPQLIEVRGEVFITEADFAELNSEKHRRGEKLFANPRNLAAGSIRQLTPEANAMRALSFFAYSVARTDGVVFARHSQSMQWLIDRQVPVCPERAVVSGFAALMEYFEKIKDKRKTLPYAIDGVVYKVDDLSQQETLGSLSRAPRFAIAHKFSPDEVQTTLLGIEISVGRTGALTPVARLSPVLVGGVRVENATLHNEEEVNRKKLRVGDTVIVRRAGDVIPEVVRSTNQNDLDESQKFRILSCPVCQSSVVRLPNEAVTRCTGGLYCKAQLKRALFHFGSRRAMDIDGLGTKLIGVLVDEIGLSGPADLYRLPDLAWEWLQRERAASTAREIFQRGSSGGEGYRSLLKHGAPEISPEVSIKKLSSLRPHGIDSRTLDTLNYLAVATIPKTLATEEEGRMRSRLGERDAIRLLAQVERSKKVTLDRFIFALGIRHVGEEVAKIISRNLESARALTKTDWRGLAEAKKQDAKRTSDSSEGSLTVSYRGIGSEIFEALATFIGEPHNVREIDRLLLAGVEARKTQRRKIAGSPFQDKRLLFTGALDSMKRPEAERQVEEFGGEIAASVTKNLDYLVVGSQPEARPTNKLSKAKELRVTILSEEQFLKMLAQAKHRGGLHERPGRPATEQGPQSSVENGSGN